MLLLLLRFAHLFPCIMLSLSIFISISSLSKRPSDLFSLETLVGAHGLPVDAVRLGLFFGLFTGTYNGLKCAFSRYQNIPEQVSHAYGGNMERWNMERWNDGTME